MQIGSRFGRQNRAQSLNSVTISQDGNTIATSGSLFVRVFQLGSIFRLGNIDDAKNWKQAGEPIEGGNAALK